MISPCPPVFLVPSCEGVYQQMANRFHLESAFTVCRAITPETTFPKGSNIVLLVGFDIQPSRRLDTLLNCLAQVRRSGGVVVGTTMAQPSAMDHVRGEAAGLNGVVHYSDDSDRLRIACERVHAKATAKRIGTVMQMGQGILQSGLMALRRREKIDVTSFRAASISLLDCVRDTGVERWVDSITGVNDRIARHCILMAGVTSGFLGALGVGGTDSRQLVTGALLHDAGKALIPEDILGKPGPLTTIERETVSRHPVLGHALLSKQDNVGPVVLDIVLHHHEFLDGTGYPYGLKGAQISDEVRIATICDIYTALIEPRPYKAALSPREALNVMSQMTGKLDPDLLRVFCDLFGRVSWSEPESVIPPLHTAVQVPQFN